MDRKISTLCYLLLLLCLILAGQAQVTLAPFVYARTAGGRPGEPSDSTADTTKITVKGDGRKFHTTGGSSIPVTVTVVSLITSDDPILPNAFFLDQNYPNPFNAATVITYGVGETRRVKVEVFNVLGQHVATLVDAVKTPGRYQTTWDPGEAASGLYFCRMVAGRFHRTRQMIQLK